MNIVLRFRMAKIVLICYSLALVRIWKALIYPGMIERKAKLLFSEIGRCDMGAQDILSRANKAIRKAEESDSDDGPVVMLVLKVTDEFPFTEGSYFTRHGTKESDVVGYVTSVKNDAAHVEMDAYTVIDWLYARGHVE